jgi:site-specific DNA recombinase
MFGKTRRDLAYYTCEPDQRHHAQRSAWQPGHPASLGVREDILLDVVHGLFAEHLFGPARRELLAAQIARHAPGPEPDRTAGRAGMLRQATSDIERRKHALIAELETQPCGGDSCGDDPDAARQHRQAIQRRFTLLVAEHRAKTGELAQLAAHQDQPGPPDPGLLAALPQLPLRLAGLPEPSSGACTTPSSSRSAITPPARGNHPRRQPEPHQQHRERDQAAEGGGEDRNSFPCSERPQHMSAPST